MLLVQVVGGQVELGRLLLPVAVLILVVAGVDILLVPLLMAVQD
jgi:hypothetical protein